MKLVQILYSGLGGHSNVAFNLLEAQKDEKISNYLIFYGVEKLPHSYNEFCKEVGVDFSIIYKKRSVFSRSLFGFYNLLRKQKPDKLILHSSNISIFIFILSKFLSFDLVVVEHTPNQVKTWLEKLNTILTFLILPKIVLLTEGYKKEICNEWWFNSKKVKVIPNGIYIDQNSIPIHPSFLQNKQNLKLSMIARFSEQKRQDILIRIIKEFDFKISNIKLVLPGDGEKLDYCKKLSEDLGLNHQVVFPGILNKSEITNLLNQTDFYIHLSEGETLSTSILQVMAAGCPIIASNIPGISQMNNEIELMELVNHNLPINNLARKIYEYISNSENLSLIEKRRENAYYQIVNKYNSEKMFESYLSF